MRLMSDETEELVAILKTGDISFLPVVKSMLDAAGIPYLVQGEEALSLFPVGPAGGGTGGRALVAVVKVPRDRSEEAKALLTEFNQTGDGELESD